MITINDKPDLEWSMWCVFKFGVHYLARYQERGGDLAEVYELMTQTEKTRNADGTESIRTHYMLQPALCMLKTLGPFTAPNVLMGSCQNMAEKEKEIIRRALAAYKENFPHPDARIERAGSLRLVP